MMAKKVTRKARKTAPKDDRRWAPKVLYAASAIDTGSASHGDEPWAQTYMTASDAAAEGDLVFAEYELKRFVKLNKTETVGITQVK